MADEKRIETLVTKVDGVASDVRTNSYKLDRLEAMIETMSSNLKTLSGQFNDVGTVAIEDHKRIEKLEKRVDVLESGVH